MSTRRGSDQSGFEILYHCDHVQVVANLAENTKILLLNTALDLAAHNKEKAAEGNA
jgi:hypothetical protein